MKIINKELKSKNQQYAWYIVNILIMLPTIIAICYEYPVADDFSRLSTLKRYQENYSYINSIILFAKNTYFNWQGTYTHNILVALTPEYQQYWVTRVFLIVLFVAFYISALIMIECVLKRYFGFESRLSKHLISALCGYMIVNSTNSGEIFLWFAGAAANTLPLASYFLSIIFLIHYFDNKSKTDLVIACVTGFIGSGGSLQVVGFGCSLLCVVLLFELSSEFHKSKNGKNYKWTVFIPVIVAIVGAVINAAAPGNFVRHASIVSTGDMPVFRTLINSIYTVIRYIYILFQAYSLSVFLMVVCAISFICNVSYAANIKKTIAITSIGFLICIVSVFPVLLGYNDSWIADTGSRTEFVCCFTIWFILLFVCISISLELKSFLKEHGTGNVNLNSVLALLLILIALMGSVVKIKTGMSAKIADDLLSGRMQQTSSIMKSIYDELSNSKGNTIVTRKSLPDSVLYVNPIIGTVPFSDNQSWINISIAEYFGLDSFTMIWTN